MELSEVTIPVQDTGSLQFIDSLVAPENSVQSTYDELQFHPVSSADDDNSFGQLYQDGNLRLINSIDLPVNSADPGSGLESGGVLPEAAEGATDPSPPDPTLDGNLRLINSIDLPLPVNSAVNQSSTLTNLAYNFGSRNTFSFRFNLHSVCLYVLEY